jgi:hypothetical protein
MSPCLEKKTPNADRNGIIQIVKTNGIVGFPKAWTVTGYLLFCGAAILVARILYEETILTWVSGPQMVGFAMAHGALPFVFITGIISLLGTLQLVPRNRFHANRDLQFVALFARNLLRRS